MNAVALFQTIRLEGSFTSGPAGVASAAVGAKITGLAVLSRAEIAAVRQAKATSSASRRSLSKRWCLPPSRHRHGDSLGTLWRFWTLP